MKLAAALAVIVAYGAALLAVYALLAMLLGPLAG
jgi:hypothetical protein